MLLGITVHWIEEESLERKKGVLACKELKESQTAHLLGKELYNILQDFGVIGKVSAVTTDNGANYVAAFRLHGPEDETSADAVHLDSPPVSQSSLVSPSQEGDDQDDDEDQSLPSIHDVTNALSCSLEALSDEGYILPPHYRCW